MSVHDDVNYNRFGVDRLSGSLIPGLSQVTNVSVSVEQLRVRGDFVGSSVSVASTLSPTDLLFPLSDSGFASLSAPLSSSVAAPLFSSSVFSSFSSSSLGFSTVVPSLPPSTAPVFSLPSLVPSAAAAAPPPGFPPVSVSVASAPSVSSFSAHFAPFFPMLSAPSSGPSVPSPFPFPSSLPSAPSFPAVSSFFSMASSSSSFLDFASYEARA